MLAQQDFRTIPSNSSPKLRGWNGLLLARAK
jgi:hypothetical protein